MRKKLTTQIRFANERLSQLREHQNDVFGPRAFWQRAVSLQDRLRYLEVIADSRVQLFHAVEKEYPELKGHSYTVNDLGIETDEPEPKDAIPAETGV